MYPLPPQVPDCRQEPQHFPAANSLRVLKIESKKKKRRDQAHYLTPFRLAAWILLSPLLDFFEVAVRADLHGWLSGWGKEVRQALHWINKNLFVN